MQSERTDDSLVDSLLTPINSLRQTLCQVLGYEMQPGSVGVSVKCRGVHSGGTEPTQGRGVLPQGSRHMGSRRLCSHSGEGQTQMFSEATK